MKNKQHSSIYNTLLGGYSAGCYGPNGEHFTNWYEYTCLYGKLRICKSSNDLKDNWIHRSIHWNNVYNGGIAWNFHVAYKSKFPFIKIGFNSIRSLFIEH